MRTDLARVEMAYSLAKHDGFERCDLIAKQLVVLNNHVTNAGCEVDVPQLDRESRQIVRLVVRAAICPELPHLFRIDPIVLGGILVLTYSGVCARGGDQVDEGKDQDGIRMRLVLELG